jgi:NAD(P)-dependent dehydrogenase (short-subunit alcohol dehydrogenase family)
VLAGVRSERAGEELRPAAGGIEPLTVDVTDAAQVAALRDRVGGTLAGLVNNAGIVVPGALEFVSLDDYRQQFEVNVIGQIAVTQALLPAIRAGKGRIVNLGSIGGYAPPPFINPYTTSKGAVRALTFSLRRELRSWGIHVALVEPGAIDTDMWETGESQADDLLAALSPAHRELYGSQIEAVRKASKRTAKMAIPPLKVAKAVEHALTARRPKALYRVGMDTRFQGGLQTLLPARTFDALLGRMIGV